MLSLYPSTSCCRRSFRGVIGIRILTTLDSGVRYQIDRSNFKSQVLVDNISRSFTRKTATLTSRSDKMTIHPTSVSEYLSTHKYPAKAHARAVAKHLSLTSGTIYLESQKSRLEEDKDQEAPFHQRRYFFYLSGCALPDCYLTYDVAKDFLTLYIPPINPEEVMWSGLPLDAEGAKNKFDIDSAKYSNELEADLKGEVLVIPGQVSESVTLLKDEGVTVKLSKDLKEAINECRVYKDDYEVALIKHANEISGSAHVALMKAAKTCKFEHELEGIFLENCIRRGARRQAYDSIIASGTNAATLHYIHNNQAFSDRLNILIDGGCEYDLYASVISRAFVT
ncbi:hypothetical protein TWF225_000146 [Orbilia oligospora]|nr:hypothetical protein TWF225_000146 [Orbilia oligospora]KAF3233729.1 hypothetical protein TWF128_002918 [Orbilia oligospora]KAF3256193.1 hypothetical protein TWF217_006439 [Orbilia oligospora]KAF3297508.1 hypothetical protein TWF132_005937 [Orbilia oligospora]